MAFPSHGILSIFRSAFSTSRYSSGLSSPAQASAPKSSTRESKVILVDEVSRQKLPELPSGIFHILLSLEAWVQSQVQMFNSIQQAPPTEQQG